MKRSSLILRLAFLGLFSASAASASPKKVLIVSTSSNDMYDKAIQGFRRCLARTQPGVEVESILLPRESSEAETLVRAKAGGGDVVVFTVGTAASVFLRKNFPSLPSIFGMSIDPELNELTYGGVSLNLPPRAFLTYIKTNLPTIKRVGILFTPGSAQEIVEGFRSEAVDGLALVSVPVPNISALEDAVGSLQGKADCLLMITDSAIYNPTTAPHLILQTIKLKLPIIALSPTFVEAGGVAGVYPDYEDNGCQAADMVGKILTGEKPSSQPIQPPRKSASVLNQIVAKRLDMSFSREALTNAERVIK